MVIFESLENVISLAQSATGATSAKVTIYPSGTPEFTPDFRGVRVIQSLLIFVCPFSFLPLCFLSFFELGLLATTVVSPNFSFTTNNNEITTMDIS
jgi:hypothetical protein